MKKGNMKNIAEYPKKPKKRTKIEYVNILLVKCRRSNRGSWFFNSHTTKVTKQKILPNISPNKTYFGFFSGLIITLICLQLLNYYFKIYNSYETFIFTLLFILSTFLGDFVESYYKRISNIKDSGNLLPGHGGFFDRFDSLIMVFIFLYISNMII